MLEPHLEPCHPTHCQKPEIPPLATSAAPLPSLELVLVLHDSMTSHLLLTPQLLCIRTAPSGYSHPAWAALWSIQSHLPAPVTSDNLLRPCPALFSCHHPCEADSPQATWKTGCSSQRWDVKTVQTSSKQLWRKWVHTSPPSTVVLEYLSILGAHRWGSELQGKALLKRKHFVEGTNGRGQGQGWGQSSQDGHYARTYWGFLLPHHLLTDTRSRKSMPNLKTCHFIYIFQLAQLLPSQ